MKTDVPKSTAPDFCRHPRIGEDGFCLDCGRRAAIKLNIPKPTPCFQCGDPLCTKEEHMLRRTHSPFANSEYPRLNGKDNAAVVTSAQLIAAGEASHGFCKKCRCCNAVMMSRECVCECHVTKPRNLSTSTDELTSLLREVSGVISDAGDNIAQTPGINKRDLITWLKCRIGVVLEAAENSEQKHEANKSKTKPDEQPEIGGA